MSDCLNTFSPLHALLVSDRTARQTDQQTDSKMYRWTDRWTSLHLTGHVIDTTDYGATPLHHHKASLQWPASHKSNIHRTSRITSCTSINNHVCSDFLFLKNNLTTAMWLKNAEKIEQTFKTSVAYLIEIIKLKIFTNVSWPRIFNEIYVSCE